MKGQILDRNMLIMHILDDLYKLRSDKLSNQYAIEENIVFFKAIRSVPKYIWWLISRATRLDREKLLELTDFSFPRWDREMHMKLIEVEKRKFPGLINPLVDRILELVLAKETGIFIGVSLGCGGMEVERQVIKRLLSINEKRQLILIGIDKSQTAHELAKEYMREIEPHIAVHETQKLNDILLKKIIDSEKHRHVIILARNDIFSLGGEFAIKSFDAVYHTLFKHHLSENQKIRLDSAAVSLSAKVLEYDGYKSWPLIVGPHTWTAWRHPAFLNGSIISDLRYSTKKELQAKSGGWNLKFFRIGTYLRESP